MGRQGLYLYKRAGSNNFWLRLVYPAELAAIYGRSRIERSLRTANRIEANALASEEVRKHKLALLAVQRQRDGKKQPMGVHKRYEPGSTTFEGEYIIVATEDELLFLDRAYRQIRAEPNRIELDLTNTLEFAIKRQPRSWLSSSTMARIRTYSKKENDKDAEIFNRWVQKNNVSKHIKNDATNVWAELKKCLFHKPVNLSTRYDAVMFVEHLLKTGLAEKTVAKKISYLSAAFNIAVDEEVLPKNVFARLAPKPRWDWTTKRQCLSDEDMALVSAHLHELSAEDRLLWTLLATTGMRLSEPFEVVAEEREAAHRFIVVGTKTPSSRRRVPLPDQVLPLLPDRIECCLFSNSPETHGKRLRYFLRRLGISRDKEKGTGDARKTVHSLRHRAATKLREAECPMDIQDELLGHTLLTVADGYGKGRSVTRLKEWQAHIAF